MDDIKKISDEALKAARPSLDDIKALKRHPVTVIAENIRSLYNVGSIFRTSDGALIEKLYLGGYTGYPPRKEIDKTALGAVESVPWEHHENSIEIVKKLKEQGNTIVSLEHTNRSVAYTEAEYSFPCTIILGNEVDGASDELISYSDGAVEIPMYGIKQSLNVSVAYGIIVYHLIDYYRENYNN